MKTNCTVIRMDFNLLGLMEGNNQSIFVCVKKTESRTQCNVPSSTGLVWGGRSLGCSHFQH